MLGMGNLLENGLGVDRNEAEAANWYRKAMAAGEKGAIGRLANLLESGRGVAKDEPEALPWWTVAWLRARIDLEDGQLDTAVQNLQSILNPKNQPANRNFTRDYEIINLLGFTHSEIKCE